jgi:hypothetical protein
LCYHGAKVLGRVDVGERWCRGGSAAARRRSELSGVAESGGWPCSASLVVRPGENRRATALQGERAGQGGEAR